MASYPELELEADDPQELLELLEVGTKNNARRIARHKSIPHPYQSGVRYQRERKGQERWQGVRKLLIRKRGDCEDLSMYLAGYYRARYGIMARCALIRYQRGKLVWYHVVVQLPNGKIIDPSKRLGM